MPILLLLTHVQLSDLSCIMWRSVVRGGGAVKCCCECCLISVSIDLCSQQNASIVR